MAIPDYPKDYPCPQVANFGAQIYSAVLRTPFEGGNTRQRRVHKAMPHQFSVEWVMKQTPQWSKWLNWMNVNGFTWFMLNIPSALAGANKAETWPTPVRLISDLKTSLIAGQDGYYWRVEADMEWDPDSALLDKNGPAFAVVPSGWIVARPRSLAAADVPTDWIISGTPPAPNSANTYTAGNPANPATTI